ncbi:hypothetical protein O7627_26310 [Solwaraspora sp. WMMD1047]|uniref:WD40 repeat domain-containing protein n=1 Tax=Solwaraspora sp. WMMD1047 TaxID=3016102 RepID=UPI002416576E|nr:hypothetical protein [Solwaraspora sp. WMMD1047]MDG4832792.1 hypothetical protein [Solwaraspora sp. WMMD1047]
MFSLYPKFWTVCRIEVAGRPVVASADKRRIRLWDPQAGETRTLARVKGPTHALCPVRVGDTTLLASAGVERVVRLWDPTSGREVARFDHHRAGRLTSLCTLPGGREGDLIVSAGNDGALMVLDPATGEPLHTMADGGSGVQAVCRVDAAGTHQLAGAGLDGLVRIWDPTSGELVHTLAGHGGWVHAVCALPVDGRTLVASGGDDGAVRLWDPVAGEPVRAMVPESTMHTLSVTNAGGGTVLALCPVRTRNTVWLASGGDFPGVWLWNPATGRGGGWVGWGGLVGAKPQCGWIRGLATFPRTGTESLVTCGYDKEVQMFTVQGSPSFRGF